MVFINAIGSVNSLAGDYTSLADTLRIRKTPAFETLHGWLPNNTPAQVASVKIPLPEIPKNFPQHNSRNNRLLLAALNQIRPAIDATLSQHAPHRIAVILGTSNSGIRESELALAHLRQHHALPAEYHYTHQELGSPSVFLADLLQIRGPAYTISTACSSSARAFIAAKRLIDADLIDAAIVGGSDALCRMTLCGFNSLQALSPTTCRPFAANRDGITIGEAAALFLLSKTPSTITLAGVGESSDAHHMSAPDPTGAGAETAIRQALQSANIGSSTAIGYINLHGTGTPLNDSMEAAAIHRIFGQCSPCSSTKHLTGHTLGTCAATEAAIACTLLENPDIPLPNQQLTTATLDPALPDIRLLLGTSTETLRHKTVLSNSFAFGGNNASLLFSSQ